MPGNPVRGRSSVCKTAEGKGGKGKWKARRGKKAPPSRIRGRFPGLRARNRSQDGLRSGARRMRPRPSALTICKWDGLRASREPFTARRNSCLEKAKRLKFLENLAAKDGTSAWTWHSPRGARCPPSSPGRIAEY